MQRFLLLSKSHIRFTCLANPIVFGIIDLKKTQFEVKAAGSNDFTIDLTRQDVKYGVQDD